ncbi:unnamed protein product [Caretta caretta]
MEEWQQSTHSGGDITSSAVRWLSIKYQTLENAGSFQWENPHLGTLLFIITGPGQGGSNFKMHIWKKSEDFRTLTYKNSSMAEAHVTLRKESLF